MEPIKEMGYRLHLDESQIQAAGQAYADSPKQLAGQAAAARRSGDVRVFQRAIRADAQSGGAQTLAGALLMAGLALEEYRQMGIPEAVFDATMSDIKIWADRYRINTGLPGLGEIPWIVKHCRLELFRLGRLQFERAKVNFPPFRPIRYFSLPVRRDEACLGVHIPEGEKLDIEACKRDFSDAPAFFQAFFPEEVYSCLTCFSWLLSSVYGNILPPDSNIVRFRGLWEIVWDVRGDRQALERIWDGGARSRRDTLLRQRAAEWLEQGNRLGMGFGLRMIK